MKIWCLATTFVVPVAVAAVLIASPSTPVAAQGPGTAPDDTLFSKIYPVFAHDRCANCHGIVKHYLGMVHSVIPETHPGGDVSEFYQAPDDPRVDCTNCHDQTGDKWQFTAPPNMEWAGLDEDQVCIMEATEARLKNHEAGGDGASLKGSYLNHLATDLLIQQAWIGYAAGARRAVDEAGHPRDKLPEPPLHYPEFLDAAAAWIKAGAPCKATAQLSNVEEQETALTTTLLGNKVVERQSAKREVNILRKRDGSATATIKAAGFHETTTTFKLDSCEMVTTVRDTWSRTGPATVAAKLEFAVKPDEYTIHFELPAETTNRRTTNEMTNTCGATMPVPPPSDITLTWVPWIVDLRCPTEFPNTDGTMGCQPKEPHDTGAADGALHRTVKRARARQATDPGSWLYRSPMAIGSADGESVPVDVKIIWSVLLNQK
jgi:hypothetical protein